MLSHTHTHTRLTQWPGGAEELASSVEISIWAFSSLLRNTGTDTRRPGPTLPVRLGRQDRLKIETASKKIKVNPGGATAELGRRKPEGGVFWCEIVGWLTLRETGCKLKE